MALFLHRPLVVTLAPTSTTHATVANRLMLSPHHFVPSSIFYIPTMFFQEIEANVEEVGGDSMELAPTVVRVSMWEVMMEMVPELDIMVMLSAPRYSAMHPSIALQRSSGPGSPCVTSGHSLDWPPPDLTKCPLEPRVLGAALLHQPLVRSSMAWVCLLLHRDLQQSNNVRSLCCQIHLPW